MVLCVCTVHVDKFTTKGKEKIEEDNLKTYGHIDQDLNLQEDNELIDETDYRKHADINGDWLDMLNEKNVMMMNVLKENEEASKQSKAHIDKELDEVKELMQYKAQNDKELVMMMNELKKNEEVVSKQNKAHIDKELHEIKELMQSLLGNLKKN